MNAYRRILTELYALEARRGIDLGLGNVRRVLARLDAPQRRFPVLHIAGTNGKGSTAAMLDAALRQAGYRVGLYTSPHLVDFTERIRIDGGMITEELVVERIGALKVVLKQAGVELTFFEIVSVLAFDVFARAGVDVAVVEVGLGGRLDATNVAEPLVTAITSIAHDHERYLGRTLEAIAREKAGVMKPDVPVVIGPVAAVVEEQLRDHARRVGAPAAFYGRDFWAEDGAGSGFTVVSARRAWHDVILSLRGRFQQTNAAIALMMLDCIRGTFPVPDEAVQTAFSHVSWPGRFDVVDECPVVVLDGAHNPAAAAALAAEIQAFAGGKRARLVFGVMRDKNWCAMWEALRPVVRDVVVTQPRRSRALAADTLADVVGRDVPVHVCASPESAVREALVGAGPDDVIVATGSLFLVADVYPVFLPRQGRQHLFDRWRVTDTDVRQAPA